MGSILWLYQTKGLFIICAPDTDETENSHGDYSWTAGYKKNNLSFLLKVRYPAINALFPELTTWSSFRFSCITIMVYIYCPIFRLLMLVMF